MFIYIFDILRRKMAQSFSLSKLENTIMNVQYFCKINTHLMRIYASLSPKSNLGKYEQLFRNDTKENIQQSIDLPGC